MFRNSPEGSRLAAEHRANRRFRNADRLTDLRLKGSVPHGLFMLAKGRSWVGSIADATLWATDKRDGQEARAGEKIMTDFNTSISPDSGVEPITRPDSNGKTDDPKADRLKTYASYAAIAGNAVRERNWRKLAVIGLVTGATVWRSHRQQKNRETVEAHQDEFIEHGIEIDVGAIAINKYKLLGIAVGSTIENSPLARNRRVSNFGMATVVGATVLGEIGERQYHSSVQSALDELELRQEISSGACPDRVISIE